MTPTLALLALVAATLALLLACLSPALVEWFTGSDADPLVVVREQDTNIRHFAQSFAAQVRERLAGELDRAAGAPEPIEGTWHGEDRYVLLPAPAMDWLAPAEAKAGRVDRLLLAGAGLTLPGGLVYEKEIFVRGDLATGDGIAVRSCFVEGRTRLGAGSTVARWLHGNGPVSCGERSRLFGRLSSDTRLQLGAESVFERVAAPVIRFATSAVEVRPAGTRERDREPFEPGDDAVFLDDRTLLLDGDCRLPAGLHIRCNLVCRGALHIRTGTRVDGAIKAWHDLRVDSGSIIRGAIVAGGDMRLAENVVAAGPLVAEGRVTIAEGCIIGGPGMPTTVTAPRIAIAPGSQVSGTVWARLQGRVGRGAG